MTTYRNVFIAIPLPPRFHTAYWEMLARLHDTIPGLRVERDQTTPHITLLFLGNQNERVFPKFIAAMPDALSLLAKTEVLVSGSGIFTPAHPKVVYVAVRRSSTLTAAHAMLHERLCEHITTANHRGFTPHLTVGRIPRPGTNVTATIHSAAEVLGTISWKFPVSKIALYGRDPERDTRDILHTIKI